MILSSVLRVRWADLNLSKVSAHIDFAEGCIKEQSQVLVRATLSGTQ